MEEQKDAFNDHIGGLRADFKFDLEEKVEELKEILHVAGLEGVGVQEHPDTAGQGELSPVQVEELLSKQIDHVGGLMGEQLDQHAARHSGAWEAERDARLQMEVLEFGLAERVRYWAAGGGAGVRAPRDWSIIAWLSVENASHHKALCSAQWYRIAR